MKEKKVLNPKYGDIRKIKMFAFFPLKLSDGTMVWWRFYFAHQEWTEQGSKCIIYSGTFGTRFDDGWVTFKTEKI